MSGGCTPHHYVGISDGKSRQLDPWIDEGPMQDCKSNDLRFSQASPSGHPDSWSPKAQRDALIIFVNLILPP
jgi:hypothetical protein